MMNGRGRAHEECYAEEFYEPLQKSLELVFGERAPPAPGFICLLKEVVVEDGNKLPGSCCLDVLYEMGGDNWGHAVRKFIGVLVASSFLPFSFLFFFLIHQGCSLSLITVRLLE
jgi:hypothetical protein